MSRYDPQKIESKWRKIWQEEGLYEPDLIHAKNPFYNLMMFPYPSSEGLHVGNMYAFTGADVFGRLMRMRGHDVLEPIGLDGFGIHSENHAIKIGDHPQNHARRTEKKFYEQLGKIGNGFSWSKKLETYHPAYYRWTQWIFVRMFKHGLAYRKKAAVNWCPSCKTVLADEQVIDGDCERCESGVERRKLAQWFFRITDYADRLLANLAKIDWTEKVKKAQRHWIGRSEGAEIAWLVDGTKEKIWTFTTRLDTIFGATFLVVAPDHPLFDQLSLSSKTQAYRQKALKKTEQKRRSAEKEKTGLDTGLKVVHPLTGERLPLWVADFVLMEYGTGAVMAVPAHDERDYQFAAKYHLPVKQVIEAPPGLEARAGECYTGSGRLINSGKFDGWSSAVAIVKILADLEEKRQANKRITYHLRDWLISRQRYWGPPIPMVYCQRCAGESRSWFDLPEANGARRDSSRPGAGRGSSPGADIFGWYPVPEQNLPVELPYLENFKPTGTGEAPLAQLKDWVKVNCPGCGAEARRETDVSDTFLDSAWYFLRYPSVGDDQQPWEQKVTKKWLPVDMYIGGAEHSVLHLLYSRFVTMAFCDWGLLDFDEPFPRFYAHGLLIREGSKMSKSKGNIIVPDEYLDRFGADTFRTYLMFLGPYDQGGDFRDTGIAGTHKFINRVWTLVNGAVKTTGDQGQGRALPSQERRHLLHRTIREVSRDLERLRYNTAIAKIRLYVNHLESYDQLSTQEVEVLLKLLAPLAPFVTEELWRRLGHKKSIHLQSWPAFDAKLAESDKVTVVVQVNGKLRGSFEVERGISQDELVEKAKNLDRVAKHLEGKKVRRTVYVPGKLVNFVV